MYTPKKVAKNNDRAASAVALAHAHAHIVADHVIDSFNQLAKKLVTCLVYSFAHKGSQKKAPRIQKKAPLSSIHGQPRLLNSARSSSLGLHT